jgi:hypothetical protein
MNTPENTPPPTNVVYHQHEYGGQQTKTSGLAVTSMIMGILSVIGGAIFFLPPLLAIIFGHVAVGSCSKNRTLGGKGMAIAGLVMGWICMAGWIIFFLFFGGLAALGIAAGTANSM